MLTDTLFLGIDIGTTKVAAVIADGEGGVRAAVSRVHEADLPAPTGRAEQDAGVLLDAAWAVVRELPEALRQRVGGIGVTGQMHGVVLVDAASVPVTPLITWQDGRCLEDPSFLDALYDATGHRLHTGYGLATLAWLRRHQQFPTDAVAASTIHDLVVARLCRLPRPVTDPSDAASWGCFDLRASSWDEAAVAATGLRWSMLPTLYPFGSVAGAIDPAMASMLGLPQRLPVHGALGDLQASLLATIQDPETDVALNLGTGGQAMVITAAPLDPLLNLPDARCRFCPYPGGRVAVVAASLSGGAAWAWLVDSLDVWLRALGVVPPPREVLFSTINALGLDASHEIAVRSHFLGERYDPSLTGSIQGLTLSSFSLGALARGLARSIVLNLHEMLPAEAFKNRTRLVGSGNALRRTPLLQHMAEAVFGLPLTMAEGREEAATGAALVAAGRIY